MKGPLFSAIIATIMYAATMGVLIATALFGVLRLGGEMLEAVGILPLRWGEENIYLLMAITGIATLPFLAWFTWWLYGKAVNGERELVGYKYGLPESKVPSRQEPKK